MLRNWTYLAISVALCAHSAVAQIRSFGAGCEAHLTRLPSMTSSVPLVAGKNFIAQLDAVGRQAPFLLVFGISNTTWSGVPLPLSLGSLGWPGREQSFEVEVGGIHRPQIISALNCVDHFVVTMLFSCGEHSTTCGIGRASRLAVCPEIEIEFRAEHIVNFLPGSR